MHIDFTFSSPLPPKSHKRSMGRSRPSRGNGALSATRQVPGPARSVGCGTARGAVAAGPVTRGLTDERITLGSTVGGASVTGMR